VENVENRAKFAGKMQNFVKGNSLSVERKRNFRPLMVEPEILVVKTESITNIWP
jgi:hypothetical protein